MKKILLTMAAIAASVSLMGQQFIKTDDVGGFDALKLSGKMNVELIKSTDNHIEAELFNADIKNFGWSVSNHTLSVSLRPGREVTANVKIYYKELNSIDISGCELSVREDVEAEMFDCVVGNGARATIGLRCQDAQIGVTGNSAVVVSGATKYLTLSANENSKVDTRGLEALSVNLSTASKAEAYVWAVERLTATANTGSTIFYKGEPTILRSKISTVGLGASINNIGK